ELGPAAAYCREDPDGQKRFQLCMRLAACFDDYQLYRDDVLLGFARGDDGKNLGPHAVWQSHLWRALLQDADFQLPKAPPRRQQDRTRDTGGWLFPEMAGAHATEDRAVAAPAHRLEQLRRLWTDPARARAMLPRRLSVFGAGTLPPAFVRLLQQAAAFVPVHLYVPQPTPHYVGDARRPAAGENALLARLGAEARELADLLIDLDVERVEVGGPVETQPGSLLECLQQDVVNAFDRAGAPAKERFRIDGRDDSVRVHDCHSPQRELEVVRDQILAAFAADDTLKPHDVLVLVPDIDRYAPYAHAVFGPVRTWLPFHVADRNPKSELPICAALLEVLQLGRDRLRTFDVLHLLEEPAVQRRFGLAASDLPVLRDMCQRAGIRWGQDGESREQRFHVPAFDENAWLPGLQRLLLGVVTGPAGDLVAGRLPVGDVTDGRSELIARFCVFVRTLFRCLEPLHLAHPLEKWASLLDDLVAELFAPSPGDDESARAQLLQSTARLRAEAMHARHTEPVAPAVLRDWLTGALQQSSGSHGFLGGAVTVAAMLPMRAVPVRCLFVCGLDDASFPRRDQPASFDLIALQRRAGDRSRRLDDRQMFLDLLLAARQKLHFTFVGHSAKDDAAGTPSVVLAELLDHIDRTCVALPASPKPSELVSVQHPLQPWSRRYRSGEDARLFTFGRHAEVGTAVAAEPAWFAAGKALPIDPEGAEIPLQRLLEFWAHPCRFFLQQSLRVRVRRDDDREDETEPFALNNLDKYLLQDAAVRRALRGEEPPRDPEALARQTGVLPVGAHGIAAFTAIDTETQQFLHAAAEYRKTSHRLLRIRGAGYTIAGEVEGLARSELVVIRIAKMKPKDRLRGWIRHLVCAMARAQGEGLPALTRVMAKDETLLIPELPQELVETQLAWLVEHYRAGQRAPLPFFERSSFAYGEARRKGKGHDDALRAARREWLP
ncbi:MAG TPA: exodeoxyribonuclease V subunit gamma, partial [Planctomycetota bacterium]|nr:exodeoxyribonuclease V subunit gamma [Planctomycetota bacterium]